MTTIPNPVKTKMLKNLKRSGVDFLGENKQTVFAGLQAVEDEFAAKGQSAFSTAIDTATSTAFDGPQKNAIFQAWAANKKDVT